MKKNNLIQKVSVLIVLISLIFLSFQKDKIVEDQVSKPVSKNEKLIGIVGKTDIDLKKQKILEKMEYVADWQIAHQDSVRHHALHWANATLYIGMMKLARLSEDVKYRKWLARVGRNYKWQPFNEMYKADDIAVSQMYLEMYADEGDTRMLFPTHARTEWVISHPSASHMCIDYRDYHTLQRWSWCDALFMAPPVYAKMYTITNDLKYLEFMDREFRMTYNLLYDQDEHLFYRDCQYFDMREKNGEKVFWGRGNGWVMGGLVRILEELPNYSHYRIFYEDLFKEMSEKISILQDDDGYWHASLLDSNSYPNPETSSTGLYVYALAWGINAGLLNKEQYMPMVLKGWSALENAVSPEGKLGWVQPVGGNPQMTKKETTDVYGVGSFLLAGSEVYRFLKN